MESRGLFLEELSSDFHTFGALLLGDPVAHAILGARGGDEVEPVARWMGICSRQNLDDIAVLNLRAQWNHPTVDARARAGIADFRVNRIGEVNSRRAARQLNHFAHRRESVNVFRIEIELQGIKKIARVFDILRPFHERAQSL